MQNGLKNAFQLKSARFRPKQSKKHDFYPVLCHFRACKQTLMRRQDHLRRVRDEFHLVHNVEKIHFVLIQRKKIHRDVGNHLNRKLRVKLPDSFSRARDVVHVCTKMPADNQKQIVAGMNWIIGPRVYRSAVSSP